MTVQHFKINSRNISTVILIVGLIGLFFIPHDFLFKDTPNLCIHKRIFGFDCPGCGMTRALYSLMHFNLNNAIHLNFAVLVLFPLFLTEIILGLNYKKWLYKIRKVLYVILIVSLSVNYVLIIIDQIKI